MSAVKINRRIGARLAALMQYRGVTDAQLAERLGVRTRRINRMTTAVSPPSAAELVRIAEALDVTSAVITGETRFTDEEGAIAGASANR